MEGKGIITCIGGMITWQPCLLLDNDRLYCRSDSVNVFIISMG